MSQHNNKINDLGNGKKQEREGGGNPVIVDKIDSNFKKTLNLKE